MLITSGKQDEMPSIFRNYWTRHGFDPGRQRTTQEGELPGGAPREPRASVVASITRSCVRIMACMSGPLLSRTDAPSHQLVHYIASTLHQKLRMSHIKSAGLTPLRVLIDRWAAQTHTANFGEHVLAVPIENVVVALKPAPPRRFRAAAPHLSWHTIATEP